MDLQMCKYTLVLWLMKEQGVRSGSAAEAAPADGKTGGESTGWAVVTLTALTSADPRYNSISS